MVGTAESINLLSIRSRHDDRIDLATANGLYGFFGFF
jgi:hypothetical protein